MKVALGKFARSGIEAFVGSDLSAGTEAALLHYSRRLRSGTPPSDFPKFCRVVADDAAEQMFEVALAPEVEASLRREMQRQGASMQQLAAHAVLVYLADLDRSFATRVEPAVGSAVKKAAADPALL